MTRREKIEVGGIPISYLTAGEGGPLLLLLHGTYWSRVWQPVLDDIAAAGLRPVAVDFPGCGRSGGELTASEASVPRLSAWLPRFLDALGHAGPVGVVGGGDRRALLWRPRREHGCRWASRIRPHHRRAVPWLSLSPGRQARPVAHGPSR